jgi:hypothetical protein
MKNAKSTLFLFSLIVIFSLSSFTTDILYNKWEKLGERRVNLGIDHDRIVVGSRDGVFSKLKIIVKNSGINMHKMEVHFGNGEKQEIAIREDIQKGGESRVIDLKGNRRVITKVDFWYDTKGLINDKAVVELWGRH